MRRPTRDPYARPAIQTLERLHARKRRLLSDLSRLVRAQPANLVRTAPGYAGLESPAQGDARAHEDELEWHAIRRRAADHAYSSSILKARSRLMRVYERLAITNPKINLSFVYCSRGDTSDIGESVTARSVQICHAAASFFSDAGATFAFMGATELIEKYRRVKQFTLELPFQDHLAGPAGGYIVIARLADYYRFISDEQRNLRRYLFDSNVRDYLGDNKVNIDIAASLEDESAPDFLWLNNGVTILATNAVISGKNMMMQDIQVVNGLQTTETIYRHFHDGSAKSTDRTLSIKIIVSNDERLRDQIIRATNNQSAIEQSALHATDKIQRDIEQILERHDFYYERRKNYFRNIGRPPERFVTPMFVAAGFVAVILKDPAKAATMKSRFMRQQNSYEEVFSDKASIEIWPRLVALLKAAETEMLGSHELLGERSLKTWRGLIALLYVSKSIGRFSFSQTEFCKAIVPDTIDAALIRECFQFIDVQRRRRAAGQRPGPWFFQEVCKEFAAGNSLAGFECVGRHQYSRNERDRKRDRRPAWQARLSAEFIDQVDALLPAQPWPYGIHPEVASKLEVAAKKVQGAIDQLIRNGRRIKQVDGKLYDGAGSVVAPDSTQSRQESSGE
jgi:hypothetical protein